MPANMRRKRRCGPPGVYQLSGVDKRERHCDGQLVGLFHAENQALLRRQLLQKWSRRTRNVRAACPHHRGEHAATRAERTSELG
jgi:hypothetical protein